MVGLVFKWLQEQGGAEAMESLNQKKSGLVYDMLARSNGFYQSPIEPGCRSCMNIPFRIGGAEGVEELEKAFVDEAKSKGMISLKGHRYKFAQYSVKERQCKKYYLVVL